MIEKLIEISREAGKKIMEVYSQSDFGVEFKSDQTPVTIADKMANDFIVEQLELYFPEVPVISEEGRNAGYDVRKEWKNFFLVDPIDGTKEFIKKNDEFSVNIGLIENKKAVAGVVFAPALDILYYAVDGKAFKIDPDGREKPIHTNNDFSDGLRVARSRSHYRPYDEMYFKNKKVKEFIPMGSSLKFCLIAEGKADIYLNSGHTSEWDTAAGHAVITAAGGNIISSETELTYNKESIKNNHFVCVADLSILD